MLSKIGEALESNSVGLKSQGCVKELDQGRVI
jgi:hypothetical protein